MPGDSCSSLLSFELLRVSSEGLVFWTWILSLFMSWEIFLSPSTIIGIFPGYSNLGWHLQSFNTGNALLHVLAALRWILVLIQFSILCLLIRGIETINTQSLFLKCISVFFLDFYVLFFGFYCLFYSCCLIVCLFFFLVLSGCVYPFLLLPTFPSSVFLVFIICHGKFLFWFCLFGIRLAFLLDGYLFPCTWETFLSYFLQNIICAWHSSPSPTSVICIFGLFFKKLKKYFNLFLYVYECTVCM